MEVGDLYQFVLLLVLVGMIIGVGVLTLDKFQATSGLTGDAILGINSSKNAIVGIATDWLPLIVVVAILAIVLGLVIRSFAGKGRR